MKTMKTFLSGLLLSAVFLLPISILAAELQPFFTFKAASINMLTSVADRIAVMTGVANDSEFREVIGMFRGIKGVDHNGIFGIAAIVNADGIISPLVLLPIADLQGTEVPGFPGLLDPIQPFLEKTGEGRFRIHTPLGTFVALQRQDHLIIASEGSAGQIPANAKALFADLEKYTVGMKFDFEKVTFETIEENLAIPLFMLAMSNPEAAEQIEHAIEIYREIYKEYALCSGGIVVNPQNADIEFSGTLVTRKGSASAKMLEGYKQQPTIFSGFRGTSANTVFTLGDSATYGQFDNKAIMEQSMGQAEAMFEGFLEQIEMEDETGEISELMEQVFDSYLKIFEKESARGASDYALSFNTDGTLLCAFDTVSLEEIQKIANVLRPRVAQVAADMDIDIEALLKRDYAPVANFKVSSFRVPMEKVVSFAPEHPSEGLKDFSPGVFWAVKEGDKQAIALAMGLDFAKTEQAFTSALTKTGTAAPVQKPLGLFSIQGFGRFLQQTIYPAAEKDGVPPGFKKVIDVLASAGNDATVTLNVEVKPDRVETSFRISGRVIQAVISAIKAAEDMTLVRPAVHDF